MRHYPFDGMTTVNVYEDLSAPKAVKAPSAVLGRHVETLAYGTDGSVGNSQQDLGHYVSMAFEGEFAIICMRLFAELVSDNAQRG